MSIRAAIIAFVSLVALTAGVPAAGARTHAAPGLPPSEQAALARMFDPQLEPLGLHTTRAALQDPHGYERSPTGTHLAIYVEPLAKGDVDRSIYVRNIMRVARVFLPSIYRRWPGLKTFDVCQEPEPIVDPRPAPIPVTQLVATRKGAASLDWKHASLVALLKRTHKLASGQNSEQLSLYVSPRTLAEPSYQAALTRAGLTSSPTTSASSS